MDTNMAQALKMAGGVLIALTIIATLTYFFRELTPFQQQIEDIQELEQTADFNKQYEVYNKSLMLGVDIISVINKAYSNNRAYIEAYGYSDDIQNNYLIDIELLGRNGNDIELTQTLDIRLTSWDNTVNPPKVKEISRDVNDLKLASKDNLRDLIGEEPKDTWTSKKLSNGIILIDKDRDTVSSTTSKAELYVNKSIYDIIIVNTELKKIFNNTNDLTKDDWTKAIFETYAYNLKTKKFRCVSVENSEQTGRIIKMTFQEI